MKLPGKKIFICAAVGFAVLAILGYRFLLYHPAAVVVPVSVETIHGSVHGPGTVQSRVSVSVSTKITGIIEKLYADQGAKVRKGQLLVELDAVELKAKKESSRAAKNRAERDFSKAGSDVMKARANLDLARSNFNRDLEVFKLGYISQASFDVSKATLKAAESEVASAVATEKALSSSIEQAESESKAASALLAYTSIRAPLDGLITVRKAEVGDTIAPGTVIFKIVDLNNIWAASWIDQTQIAQLREGQKASIKLRSGRTYRGKVARINREADTVTRELEIDVKFDELPKPLVIGEETEVYIETGSQSALAVPLSSIIEQDGIKGVFAVTAGVIVFRKVSLGLNDDKKVVVLEGLKKGELVVINPSGFKPRDHVRPVIKSPGR